VAEVADIVGAGGNGRGRIAGRELEAQEVRLPGAREREQAPADRVRELGAHAAVVERVDGRGGGAGGQGAQQAKKEGGGKQARHGVLSRTGRAGGPEAAPC